MKRLKIFLKSLIPPSLKRLFTGARDFILRHSLLQGSDVTCPVCQSSFKRFGSFGENKRPNSRCLKCGSLERHRLLWTYLHERTDLMTGDGLRLLHFAPEKRYYKFFSDRHPGLEYHPCDIFPEAYNFGSGVPVEKVDVMQIPHEDNYFDVILCNHVLEHIPDDRGAMKELFRVMKKGGYGIFQVPLDKKRDVTYEDPGITDPAERLKVFGQEDHVRVYGWDYLNRLEEVGFKVTKDRFVKEFSPEEVKKLGFKTTEVIFRCHKPG